MIWILFLVFILSLLLLDLGVFHRHDKVMSTKEAMGWTLLWISISLIFNIAIYFAYKNHWLGLGLTIGNPLSGRDAALKFFTGYVLEKSLSVDNIFVMAVIFSYFKIEEKYQHKILFWGIVGALVFRALTIMAGIQLIEKFEWMVYLLGAILIFSASKMLFSKKEEEDLDDKGVVKFLKRIIPIATEAPQNRFIVKINGKRAFTVSLLALLVIEFTDILFALDSIPAIIAITTDKFIVFSSNVLALLGLRALYFVLASSLTQFKYLQTSLAFVLAFVGIKMITEHYFVIPVWASLTIILILLSTGIIASIATRKKSNSV